MSNGLAVAQNRHSVTARKRKRSGVLWTDAQNFSTGQLRDEAGKVMRVDFLSVPDGLSMADVSACHIEVEHVRIQVAQLAAGRNQ